jgi:hypothetical protein
MASWSGTVTSRPGSCIVAPWPAWWCGFWNARGSMAGCSSCEVKFDGASPAYLRVLWTVIAINASMFVVEMISGIAAGSMALQADALDFLGDTATYAISLYVIGRPAGVRASAALLKGVSLGTLGLWVLGATIYRVFVLGVPDGLVMGWRRTAGLRRECDQRAAPAPLPRRRCQCALGLAVQPQRRARQPCRGGRGERRDRDRHRMAGPPGRGRDGEPVPVLGDQHRAPGAGRARRSAVRARPRRVIQVTKSTSCRAEMRMASSMSARSCSRSNSSFSRPAGETQNRARVGALVLLA